MSILITHDSIPPVYSPDSKILILGTMPSPKSREAGFYYGHPQNRFWKLLPDLFGEPALSSIEEKTSFLHRHRIALWDVLYSCRIEGADDSSIKDPVPNDFTALLAQCPIEAIFATGAKAAALYKKHCYPVTGISAVQLPSTSPANCRTKYPELLDAYRAILKYL